jgi:CRISPR-associated protein Cmr3
MTTENIKWLVIEPLDTLTFRGSESMAAGENHESTSLFPPLPSTIIGAIRTAVMRQQGINPQKYLDNPIAWVDRCPLLGTPENPGFELVGPLFMLGEQLLLPAPANWFMEKRETMAAGTRVPIQVARPLEENGGQKKRFTGSVPNPFWIRNPLAADMKSMDGYWVSPSAFELAKNGGDIFELLLINGLEETQPVSPTMIAGVELCVREERVGIALDNSTRRVREGYLYLSQHVRLKPGIRLVAGIIAPAAAELAEAEILQLGGEQRVCRYWQVDNLSLPDNHASDLVMALSPVATDMINSEMAETPRIGGKILRVGGWDMSRGFHKELISFYPAGTVFKYPAAKMLSRNFLRI